MNDHSLWVVVSKQINPNDFYVKVDGSEYYTAFWISRARSEEDARALVAETVEDLVLGETQILSCSLYKEGCSVDDADISSRIDEHLKKLTNDDDVQLAAWLSTKGGCW